jgi:hypothetical protein
MQKIKTYTFLSCLKATEFLEKKEVLGLSFMEEMQLRMHLSICKKCSIYQDQIRVEKEEILREHKPL